MDKKQFCFIICYNNSTYLNECLLYINQLIIPEGYTLDIITITEADSMTSGYQAGMKSSNAKYKIYLHQDVFIINRHFLENALSIFKNNTKVGMIGMVGTKKLPQSAIMWDSKNRIGALRSCSLNTVDDYFDIPINPLDSKSISTLYTTNDINVPDNQKTPYYESVDAIDGLLMMTQYDIDWREDIFDGWDFYDVSQSFEFRRAGYQVVVPYQKTPWTLHDCGFLNMSDYDIARDAFIKEYNHEY